MRIDIETLRNGGLLIRPHFKIHEQRYILNKTVLLQKSEFDFALQILAVPNYNES